MPSQTPHHSTAKRHCRASSIHSSHQLNRVNSTRSGEQGHCQQEASSFSAAADYSQSDSIVSAASSDGLSQDEGEIQQDNEEDIEDVSGKVLTEFGCRGDLWWDDFIAAKEEMLTEVLQVSM